MNKLNEIDYSKDPIYTRAVDDIKHIILKDMEDIIQIQCSNGNWNYDAYMHGLANGLIMAKSLVDKKPPIFLDPPKKWLNSYPNFLTKIKWFFKKPETVSSKPILGSFNQKY